MDIFPIGLAAAATSLGTIDSISYKFFEPNNGCDGSKKHDISHIIFQNKSIVTRKNSEPTVNFSYKYENIFHREYAQIEHFNYYVNDGLTSFYAVDFSNGITPTNVAISGSDWNVSVPKTNLYSTVTNYKANRGFLWNGLTWKEGAVTSITTNTTIKLAVSTDNYGSLTSTQAASGALLYPLYKVRFIPNALENFKTSVFIKENINLTNDGGWVRSGELSFIGVYRV